MYEGSNRHCVLGFTSLQFSLQTFNTEIEHFVFVFQENVAFLSASFMVYVALHLLQFVSTYIMMRIDTEVHV